VKYSDDEIKGNDRIIFYKLLLEVELNLGNVTFAKSILNSVEKMMLDTREIFYMPELLKLKGLFYLKVKDYSMAECEFKKSDAICIEKNFIPSNAKTFSIGQCSTLKPEMLKRHVKSCLLLCL
jgi:hypothetical protein